MKKFILALFLASGMTSQGAQTLIKQEPFIGPGRLTSTAPGANFSSVSGPLTLVRVGPRPTTATGAGWSADIRSTGSVNYRGTINLAGPASLSGMWGAWVRVKTLPPAGGYMSVLQLLNRGTNVVMDFTINSDGIISTQPYNSGGAPVVFTSPAIVPNTWVWLAVAWQIQSGANYPYGIRCMSMPLGGTQTTWGSADGLCALDTSFSAVNVGLATGGTGPDVRIGCPTLYSIGSFSDFAYPTADIAPPVNQSNNWYVNPATGNDNNDGATPATAWRTASKVTTESFYSGMLDSNATGPGNGDVLTIDTSSAPLLIDASTLTFNTQGLKVQPASGQTYIKCQAEDFVANASFTPTPGLSKTYQTADTQSNVVPWENDKWMWHVKSAAFGAAAAITDPRTNTTTTYASTGAALDAVPGSFYTDGTNLYIHPFGDTNPRTDGKIYTRSINRQGLAAVAFTAGNYRAIGFSIKKTTLVDSSDNCFGAYCFQDGVPSGTGQSSSIEGCYFAYGYKHCLGSTNGLTASTLLVLDTECEQGHPYCGYGGQTPFVSYSGATTADNIHIYRGCTCLARSGLIGSTTGDPVGTGGDIIYSHNNGTGVSFASITLDNCNFASGSVTIGVANNLVLTHQTQIGEVNTYCPNTAIHQTTFTHQMVSMRSGATNLTLQNCLFKPTFILSQAPPFYGLFLLGNVTIQGCTFDLSGITGDSGSFFQQGIIQRTGLLNLTFQNNAYVVPAGESLPLLYGATSSDTLTFDHNAYNLGAGTILARAYAGEVVSDLTFAQWQALGEDCTNSTVNASLLLQADVPQSGSPLFNAGLDLGSTADFTGTVYPHRNTIGAYEGTSAYLAPQSITGFPPLLAPVGTAPVSLPATTSAGLAITYTVVSGPAQISGHILTLTGAGAVTLRATQAGNGTYAPLTATETLSPTSAVTDTPTLPSWGLALLAALLLMLGMTTRTSDNGPLIFGRQ